LSIKNVQITVVLVHSYDHVAVIGMK